MNETKSPTKTLIVDKELPHPPQKVWRALTQAPLIEQWLLANDFVPVVGHTFTLRSTPMPHWNGIIDGKVLVVEEPVRLSYTWGSMGLATVVTWTLTPTKTGTQLRMEQSGFRSDEDANYRGATYGWQKFLGNLERVVGTMGAP